MATMSRGIDNADDSGKNQRVKRRNYDLASEKK
jgi:hypothetical protein